MKPDGTLMETRRASKIASVTGGFHVDKAPNATERLTGYDFMARAVGKVQITKLTIKVHLQAIDNELEARGIIFNSSHNVTSKKDMLMADEYKRWLNIELAARNINFTDTDTDKQKEAKLIEAQVDENKKAIFDTKHFAPITDISNFDF
jgi:hypothetical protein